MSPAERSKKIIHQSGRDNLGPITEAELNEAREASARAAEARRMQLRHDPNVVHYPRRRNKDI